MEALKRHAEARGRTVAELAAKQFAAQERLATRPVVEMDGKPHMIVNGRAIPIATRRLSGTKRHSQ